MGNKAGHEKNMMAITCLEKETSFEKKELLHLQRHFSNLAKQSKENVDTITKEQMQEALLVVGIKESDSVLLDRIFDVIDTSGDNQIDFKEFVCGIAPLIKGNIYDKLDFSFELFDVDKTGEISSDEMSFILKAMNSTCSYFGDQNLDDIEIERLVHDIFEKANKKSNGKLTFKDYIQTVINHPTIATFLTK